MKLFPREAMTDCSPKTNDCLSNPVDTSPRTYQLLATVTGAFALPLMVYVAIGGKREPISEFVLLCMSVLLGAATGFSCFIPQGGLSDRRSLLFKMTTGASIGAIAGMMVMSLLRYDPLAPFTLLALCFVSVIGALSAWCLTLKDDIMSSRRRGQELPFAARILFGSGSVSFGAWAAVAIAAGIGYVAFDTAMVMTGQRPTRRVRVLASATEPAGQTEVAFITTENTETTEDIEPEQADDSSEAVHAKLLPPQIDALAKLALEAPKRKAAMIVDELQRDPPLLRQIEIETPQIEAELSLSLTPPLEPVPNFDNLTPSELVESFEELADYDREGAISALDRIDPDSTIGKKLRKPIARRYRDLAGNVNSSRIQRSGIRGMLRWGGKFSLPYFHQMLEGEPSPSVAEDILAAFTKYQDDRAVIVARRLKKQPRYAVAASAYIESLPKE